MELHRGVILQLPDIRPSTFSAGRALQLGLEHAIRTQICDHCDGMAIPADNIYLNHRSVLEQKCLYDEATEFLTDDTIRQLHGSVKSYIEPILTGYLLNREQTSAFSCKLNFSVAIMHFKSIIITYEVYSR